MAVALDTGGALLRTRSFRATADGYQAAHTQDGGNRAAMAAQRLGPYGTERSWATITNLLEVVNEDQEP
jgi:hypothetical protein